MVNNYIKKLNIKFKTGISTEHSYRGDLQILLESLSDDVLVTNEPKRIKCGAPDYIITENNIPIGYIEAKDIGASLKKTDKTEQLKRYKASLDNLILTDYLDFWLYRGGKFITSVAIAEISGGKLTPLAQNYQDFEDLILNFYTHTGQSIKSAQNLAEMMAGKARMMQAVIDKALCSDVQDYQNSSLKDQMEAFKRILIHDITPSEFADIYAQTIAYGMFAARLNDPTLDDFSRREAAELIPKTNPFLRRLFGYIAGPDIDDRILWIVDALADIFRATDVAAIMHNFGSSTQMNDPVIHFYETFLAKYNPKLRKSRGVWYTPEPVVNFIVRAVDDILKTEFDLPQGLADTSKVQINAQGVAGKVKKDVHKVQILDPATGTGTFLAEVIKQIHKKFKGQQGIWSRYVEKELIPRLNGFEILMASYAMAHLKLDMLLRETGYKPKNENRFRVFLTNSLEEAHPDSATLFATWLSQEATEANQIKRDTPVMCVIGNPPYAISSSNKGDWIDSLMNDYKRGLKERNIQPLSDDYIKFIRYAQYFIERNKEGILAFITNNSFLDGVIHRVMRKSIYKCFDKIYIIDLHGSLKRKEIAPDGYPDENVFDIQPGVCILIFIKKKGIKKSINIYDLLGKRKNKYAFCNKETLSSINWKTFIIDRTNHLFKYIDNDIKKLYDKYLPVINLIPFKTSGIKTHGDSFLTNFSLNELRTSVTDHFNKLDYNPEHEELYCYRPLNIKWLYNDSELIGRSRKKTIYHLKYDNVGIILVRQSQVISTEIFSAVFITKCLTDTNMFRRGGPLVFPLYLYPPESNEQQTFDDKKERKPNLDADIVKQIAKSLQLTFTTEKEATKNTFAPIDILDYIYAVLHSPSYREKYKEFLKIDFPRVPYPKNKTVFWQLVTLGGELRTIHLLENPIVEQYITTYPEDGDNIVTRRIVKKDYEITDTANQTGHVWINAQQYFGDVPQAAWDFYIGGYQPARKWLKDRRGRELAFEDILHYQKIIVALTETDRIMKCIDLIDFS
ncbi:MAG: DNA methyltransferase [Candidatus Cloacimonetes bacterium 4572_55]|nr:MAG: DNA methyltransferase [Candidatus Cloacimonetes bacterium 4572_55]